MKNTVKNLLIAQEYSNAAKDIQRIGEKNLHYKKIHKIADNSISYNAMVCDLYWEKTTYISKALKSAKREKIEVIYDDCEGCLYFEFNFGQCSFHIKCESILTENVKIISDYEWSGLHNTGELLEKSYNEIFN